MMSLDATRNHWNQLGEQDPFWAVLTDPKKKGGRWEPAEFFALGVAEIAQALEEISRLNIALPHNRALDFGCGVGRLSQALSRHFEEVHGVDIAPSMIGHANRFNEFSGKCHYHLNGNADLGLFPNDHFDFVYSVIALQHIETRFAKGYLREFFRVLKLGGVAIFQVIAAARWRKLVPDFAVALYRRLKHGDKPYIGMFGIPERQILQLLHEAHAEVLNLQRNDTGRWTSLRYIVRKQTR